MYSQTRQRPLEAVDARWQGLTEYQAIFSRLKASLVVQSQLAEDGKLEPRPCQCSVLLVFWKNLGDLPSRQELAPI